MANDPIPEGFISLVEAYGVLFNGLHATGGRSSDIQGSLHNILINAFANGDLEAFVRLPGQTDNYRLPSGSWAKQWFAERVFMSEAIAAMSDGPWSSFVGRTPFVRSADFERWVAQHLQGHEQRWSKRFDPLKEAHWNLAMAAVWIDWRTPGAVREQWPDYRAAAYGEEGGGALCMLIGSAGKREILLAAAAARLPILAEDQSTMEIGVVSADEWPFLDLAGDRNFQDTLEKKGSGGFDVRYRKLVVRTADVLKLWPPKALEGVPHVDFERFGRHVYLYQAAVWVACEGRPLSSENIPLDEGFERLRATLASGELLARGVNRATALREDIPADYWERASYAERPRSHKVDFIDPSVADEEGGFGGVLAPYSNAHPGWESVSVERDRLFAAFHGGPPEAAVAVSAGASDKAKRAHAKQQMKAILQARIDEWKKCGKPVSLKWGREEFADEMATKFQEFEKGPKTWARAMWDKLRPDPEWTKRGKREGKGDN